MELGYHLSAEEHDSRSLVANAVEAERRGFTYAFVSDHFHPWLPEQGHSPFVWSLLGAMAEATEDLHLLTGVTCPTIRIHPAIIAQAAATTADLSGGRFSLGIGSGENLNEHVLGDRWPNPAQRLDMLEEAIDVMRALWTGDQVTHRGPHYTVEEARLYDLPEEPLSLVMAASGSRATSIARDMADGLVTISSDADQVRDFRDGDPSGEPRPVYGKMDVCWAESDDEARATTLRWWGNAGMGPAGTDLRTPEQFAALLDNIDDEAILDSVITGPDPEPYHQRIDAFADAGVTHVYLHQVGPDQAGFFDFASRHLLG
jgi:coenzyme F420-dependent glucose-6-phosphate dehydrogenase